MRGEGALSCGKFSLKETSQETSLTSAKIGSDFMNGGSVQSSMDYTRVPVGLRIEGQLWAGESTTFTEICPKCGRIGLASVRHETHLIIVHTGLVNGNVLEGIDYCTLELY